MHGTVSRFLFVITLLSAVGAPGAAATTASAQEPSRAETAAARRLFRQGMRAGRQDNWDGARDAFAQAYEIVPRPRILLNLASAQARTGLFLEATESYQTFLRQVTSGPDAEYRQGVEEELAGLEERTPRVNIDIQGLRDGDEVRVDDTPISRAVLRVELPLNPGVHSVTVVRAGGEVTRDDFNLEEGQQYALSLDAVGELPPPMLQDGEADLLAPGDGDGSGGVLASPWFWGGVGAAVLTGVIIGIVVATSSGGPERQTGNFGDGRLIIE